MPLRMRSYAPTDLDALYSVCLKTGDAGNDAAHQHYDAQLLGHIYVGPYVHCYPDLAFILEDEHGVCGYVLGALDTPHFHAYLAATWFPPLQDKYQNSQAPYTEKDMELLAMLRNPPHMFPDVLAPYPSELHIDILPHAQGKGWGKRLMHALLGKLREEQSKGVHLGMHKDNVRARNFYEKLGFQTLKSSQLSSDTVYMVMRL